MSVLTVRGGIPRVFRASIDATGRVHAFGFDSNFLQIKNSLATVRLYFVELDWTNNENYVEIYDAQPWEGPVEADRIWLRSAGVASLVEVTAYQRRG